jgi:hypothetical protein
VLNNAQRVQVVVEVPPMSLQTAIKRTFSRVPKRRMSNIVHKRQRFRQIFVQPKRSRSYPSNLCDLNRVGQPTAKVIRGSAGEHLGLARQSAKSA